MRFMYIGLLKIQIVCGLKKKPKTQLVRKRRQSYSYELAKFGIAGELKNPL